MVVCALTGRKCSPVSRSLWITSCRVRSPAMYSTSPAETCQPSSRCTLGCRRSRSISSTRFCERATSEARLTANVVLPSSGSEEVTSTTFGRVLRIGELERGEHAADRLGIGGERLLAQILMRPLLAPQAVDAAAPGPSVVRPSAFSTSRALRRPRSSRSRTMASSEPSTNETVKPAAANIFGPGELGTAGGAAIATTRASASTMSCWSRVSLKRCSSCS